MRTRTKLNVVEQAQSLDDIGTIQFVVAVLRQHEKEFDRLVTELNQLTARLSETELVISRIERIDKKLEALRSEITSMTKCHPLGRRLG